jgi:ribonuclease D
VEDALSRYPRQRDEVDVVFAAIEHALELPESELPARAAGERTRVSAAVHRRVDALRAWRDEQACASQLDPSVLLSQRLIDRLALAAPRTLAELAGVEGLRQWRVTEWGPALLTACA